MLDTDFPRPPGDVGHPASWRIPILFGVIQGASARLVVNGGAAADAFVAAGNTLAGQGAVGLITSCGFLIGLQDTLAARCRIPVATSALLMVPMLQRCIRGQVGVITYDARALAPLIDPTLPVAGLPPNGAFRAMIEHGAPTDHATLEAEAVTTARHLLDHHADIGAIVLECTNLPPFAAAIHAATHLPVHDVITMGHWFHAGLVARPY